MTAAASEKCVGMRTLRRFAPRTWKAALAAALLSAVALALAVPSALTEYHLQAGRRRLDEGDSLAALEQFRAASRMDPDRADIHFWLARASRKAGGLEGVRSHLDEALRLGYEDRDRLRREWRLVLAETGRIREVEAYLPEMLATAGPDDVEVCEAFVTGYRLNLRFKEALVLLHAWQTDYPEDYRPHLHRGRIYAGQERWPDADAALREALRRAPDDRTVRRELAEALLQLGKLDEAEDHLRRVVDSDPADADAVIALARVLQKQGASVEALALVRRIRDQKPQEAFEVGLLTAELALETGDAQEAVRLATPLVELWPDDFRSRYVLGRALRAAGRPEEAEAHLKTYAALEQNRARVEELLEQVKRRPDDAELRYELGLLALRHLSRRQGVLWLQSVFQYQPDHPGAHRALAEYYAKIGESELARTHQRFASTVSPSGPRRDGVTAPHSDPSHGGDATR